MFRERSAIVQNQNCEVMIQYHRVSDEKSLMHKRYWDFTKVLKCHYMLGQRNHYVDNIVTILTYDMAHMINNCMANYCVDIIV